MKDYLINAIIIGVFLGVFAGQSWAFEELEKIKMEPAEKGESLVPGLTAHYLVKGEDRLNKQSLFAFLLDNAPAHPILG